MLIIKNMARPHCCRRVSGEPSVKTFKPAGVPGRELEEVWMTLDELEALRLADLLGLYQEEAAGRMGVSRATFGRIVESARRKAAEVLVAGKALRIEGGPVELAGGACRKKNRRRRRGTGGRQKEQDK
jgi:predicted DNA-binding protein (UPF0251 family)